VDPDTFSGVFSGNCSGFIFQEVSQKLPPFFICYKTYANLARFLGTWSLWVWPPSLGERPTYQALLLLHSSSKGRNLILSPFGV
jgi:hypothetical protein